MVYPKYHINVLYMKIDSHYLNILKLKNLIFNGVIINKNLL